MSVYKSIRENMNKRLIGGKLLAYGWGDTYKRTEAKIGRNDLCPCGSGKKYKHCCLSKKETV